MPGNNSSPSRSMRRKLSWISCLTDLDCQPDWRSSRRVRGGIWSGVGGQESGTDAGSVGHGTRRDAARTFAIIALEGRMARDDLGLRCLRVYWAGGDGGQG